MWPNVCTPQGKTASVRQKERVSKLTDSAESLRERRLARLRRGCLTADERPLATGVPLASRTPLLPTAAVNLQMSPFQIA